MITHMRWILHTQNNNMLQTVAVIVELCLLVFVYRRFGTHPLTFPKPHLVVVSRTVVCHTCPGGRGWTV